MLPATGLPGLTVAKRLNDPYYLLPFVAGFLGIAAKQSGKHNGVAALAGTWAVITTAWFGWQARKATPAALPR